MINLPIYGRNGFCEFCFYKKTFGSTTNHSCTLMNPVTGTFTKSQCNESEVSDNTPNVFSVWNLKKEIFCFNYSFTNC